MSRPSDRLRIAVVGVGYLGKHHARILAACRTSSLSRSSTPIGHAREEIAAASRHDGAVRFARSARHGRCGVDRGADRTAPGCRAAVPRGRRAGAGREADGGVARGGRRADRHGCAPGRGAGGRPYGAIQSGRPGRATALDRSPVHRSPSSGHVPGTQPRHRRRVRPDDSRPRCAALDRQERGRVDRGRWRARADRSRGHRQRQNPVRERLHREPDRQPHQPGSREEDPVLPAGGATCRSTTRRRRSRCTGWSRAQGPRRRSRAAK